MTSLIRPFVQVLDPNVNRLEKELDSPIVVEPSVEPPIIIPSTPQELRNYSFAEDGTYGLALKDLRSKILTDNPFHPGQRPLSLKETLRERVENYNCLTNPNGTPRSDDERRLLFNRYLFGCTGIHYHASTDDFSIIPVCNNLITLPENFNQNYLNLPFNSNNGIQLNRTQAKYQTELTKKEILNHKGWLALVEDDKHLLKEYVDIAFKLKPAERLMYFWLRSKSDVTEDELRALCVLNIGSSSDADGYYNLNDYVRFLLKLPPSSQTFLGGRQ